MNAIEINNLTKSFGGFTLDNITLNLPSGTIMGLVGENGAGKSTTIKLIMDAIPADSGAVSVLGVSNKSKEFVKAKQEIGIVLDEACFPEVLTADNINRIMKTAYTHWDEKTYFDFMKRFKLPLNKKFADFSRGMKMKLSIGTALSHKPKLLILDEATSGLDPMARDEILDVFNEFTRDESNSILLSSHIVSDLEKICDYIAFIHRGRLVVCEEKDELITKYAVLKLPENSIADVPANSIVGRKKTAYGWDLLVIANKVSTMFKPERTTLEEIILLMAREEI